MKRALRTAALGAATAAVLGSVLAGPAQASVRAQASGRYDCTYNRLCLWDGRNYHQIHTWTEVSVPDSLKCGKRPWVPRGPLPRSVWNRTKYTWYGLDKKGKVRETVHRRGMRGSLDPDIAAWKSITHWCWK